jgi:PiT family inorganic phosphate transporter
MLAMRQLITDIGNETVLFKELKNVPNDRVRNFRNDLYLISEALRLVQKSGQAEFSAADAAILANYKKHVDHATRFIPLWVKVAVAMALGLGTMVGWKRIVVTVGEKIGKDHLTYAQGAAAEITAMATIGAADWFGMPVSTTHVLFRHCRYHGCQPLWPAMGDRVQPAHGLGPHPARRHGPLRIPLLGIPQHLLVSKS